ncbi:VTT domain-containing protein [Heyndrickxia sp. NPDC080065]|uniref:VTT domain-containing protein n=1 Tax=Heyndrickxia sp. NPDC080065 TaxID=3390568 RepID=UPI003CFCEAF9
MNWLFHLIDNYSYIVLFFSLMLELIIVPIPNEILMSYVGFLVFQGKLNLYLSIMFGGLGGIIGVTISYWIGYKLGAPFFYKYGSKFHMGPDKIEKISKWNKKYGKRLLLFSFFIPGVRHITSLFSGITRISFKTYAFFAYIGVFIWVGTFITLGKIFGPKWAQFHQQSKLYVTLACIGIGVIYLTYFLIKSNKEKIKENMMLLIENTIKRFNSFLKTKILIFGVLITLIALIFLMAGLIQDFIGNEFGQLNTIVRTVVMYTFTPNWKSIMVIINSITTWKVLAVIILLTIIWILTKGENKRIELQYYLISLAGAVFLGKGLNLLFHFITSGKGMFSQTFPHSQTLSSFVIFFFFMYVVIRHGKSALFKMAVFILTLFILLAVAVSEVYLGLHVASDLVAGYAFGGVWVSFNIFLLEVSRLLTLIKQTEFPKER